ncbi:hypothetical protein ABG067_001803 [Albugo candida]
MSEALRLLKYDLHEYIADEENRLLLKSGGHYWFSVSQVSNANVSIVQETKEPVLTDDAGTIKDPFLLLSASQSHVVEIVRWERIHAVGNSPSPRRYHSMTCLPNTKCRLDFFLQDEARDINGAKSSTSHDKRDDLSFSKQQVFHGDQEVIARRILVFGGQSEDLLDTMYNDLHLLVITSIPMTECITMSSTVKTKPSNPRKTLARWIKPQVSGSAPNPRDFHVATLMSPKLVLITGGRDGSSSLRAMDIYCLHIEPDESGLGAFRWSRPLNLSVVPSGREAHAVRRVSSNEIIIFGGNSLNQLHGFLDVHQVSLSKKGDYELASWKVPDIAGPRPFDRRGHSIHIIGNKMIVFGGQRICPTKEALSHANSLGQLLNDLIVLDIEKMRWYIPKLKQGEAPCARRGFKSQYFGSAIVISSGFVHSTTTNRADRMLPSTDIHILDICT